jgi:hypothetical protein
MKPRLTSLNILTFLALLFICHELHEISHTAVARLQCGCWGARDFNVWDVCAACASAGNIIWATIAGPLFTYALIWAGFLLMSKRSTQEYHSLGWVLVFANKPFARLFTVLMKGGDESSITRTLLDQQSLSTTAWIVELIIVLLLIVPPLVRAWQQLHTRNKTILFISFLVVPMLIEFILLHKLGNALLQKGMLDQTGLLGSPVLINVWTGIWFIVLLFTWKALFKWMAPAAGVSKGLSQ